MKLTRQDIRAAVGDAAYQRGHGYFQQDRVLRLRVEPAREGCHIEASTAGSGSAVYEQVVDVDFFDTETTIDGECTCPVGYNCKHVAAVCLAWMERPANVVSDDALAPAAFRRWLDAVAAAGAPARGRPEGEFIAYLLHVDPDHEGAAAALAIEARVVRPRANGNGLTRGREVDLYNLSVPGGGSQAATAIDREIAGLLMAGGGYWRGAALSGGPGYHALLALVDSERCWLDSTAAPPLRRGAERLLELAWQTRPGGDTLELEARLGDDTALLDTLPPLYLDLVRHEVGTVTAPGLNARQVALLAAAPVLPRELAEECAQTFAASHPSLPLPTPAPLTVRDSRGQPAVPRLRLAGHDDGQRHQPYVELEFAYGAARVSALPAASSSLVEGDDGLVRVHRDRAAEEAAHARLLALGFAPLASETAGLPPTRAAYAPAASRELERASRWSAFVRDDVGALEAAGWRIETDASFALRFASGRVIAALDESGRHDWFALGFSVEVDGVELPLVELLAPVLDADWSRLPATVSVPLGGHRYVDVPAARLRPLLDTLHALFARLAPTDGETLQLSRADSALISALAAAGVEIRGGDDWRALGERLADFAGIAHVPPDAGLAATLRGYQQRGLDWLQFLREYGFNGILADDMGLGKTVQTLAHLLVEQRAGRLDVPALLVAPTSLMGNWKREAARFAPALRVVVLHGQARHARWRELRDADLVLTTYPLLARDTERLLEQPFHSVILDEAQAIKNPRAKAAQVVRAIDARHRLCLTGTPLENHLGELWALFDFLMPGFLGSAEGFRRHYRQPVEQDGNAERQAELARRVAPFVLRRTKQQVATELPPKTEMVQRVELGPAQAELYESIRATVDKRVREAIARQGLARSHITILDALLKLRQACCDPRLLELDEPPPPSAKLEVLLDLLEELLAEGRKVLLFSQFTSMLALIESELDRRGVLYAKLTGRTRNRDAAIAQFREGDANLFLISLKAGGVGLNLTEADTVIHYDPWWNPAVEAQATDRAYRIGQTQPVFVYKLIVQNSVEEKMLELQEKKRALAAGIYAGADGNASLDFDAAALAALFAPLAASDEDNAVTAAR
ncbi:MAG: DEAD/DEAH box helicase [Gammaproteobacteria bacterium]